MALARGRGVAEGRLVGMEDAVLEGVAVPLGVGEGVLVETDGVAVSAMASTAGAHALDSVVRSNNMTIRKRGFRIGLGL